MHPSRLRLAFGLFALLGSAACGGATRFASPQGPGKAALTGADVPRVYKVLVAERGSIGMVTRGGCVASLGTLRDATGDEMRVRCPKPERLTVWFRGLDRILASVPVERTADDEEEVSLPAAELVTAAGAVLRVTRKEDAVRLLGEVRALAAELGANEEPRPGPATAAGWQMMRMAGPAHVYLGGAPANGVLDARVSTTGQYLCEFVTRTSDGPLHASKSGWIGPEAARTAIDEVLSPFQPTASGERAAASYAAATTNGAERRANSASTTEVFARFSSLQDALGDACLPELEPPSTIGP